MIKPTKHPLPFRQVHLDFHTSREIPEVGRQFAKEQFQEALQLGRINSINLFAKCHHGFSYHPTDIGCQHPGLNFDLFGAQLEACREIGVETPAYISAGFDEYYIDRNPGHIVIDADGYDPLNTGYKRLCFNTAYLDYFVSQVVEMIKHYDVEGVWTDIVGIAPCVCRTCQTEMFRRGMNPRVADDVMQLAREVQHRFFTAVNQAVEKHRPAALIFHNQGHIPKGDHTAMDAVTHLELESLPTGGWGYDHFPLSAKYAATQDKQVIGMTGKFHTTWGEFGGFKHPNALRYETAAMLAYGTRCCIGDQLHPSGLMNMDTYDRIRVAYEEVETKEAYCRGAVPYAEIAMLAIESLGAMTVTHAHEADRDVKADTGCSRVLLESQIMFDIIDTEVDFSSYKLIIVPDEGRLSEKLATKLNRFLEKGGKLLLSGVSGMELIADRFVLPVGTVAGSTASDMDYIQLEKTFVDLFPGRPFVSSPFVISGDNLLVEPKGSVRKLGEIHRSYFNRELPHFTSHQHAPDKQSTGFPAAFIDSGILYFAPRLFTDYALRGQSLCRDFIACAIELFLGYRPTKTSLPSAGRISLMRQAKEKRFIFHIMYATPIKRGDAVFPRWGIKSIEVIEDVLPVRDVSCTLSIPEEITAVKLAASGLEIAFKQEADSVTFTIPEINCHEMVVLDY